MKIVVGVLLLLAFMFVMVPPVEKVDTVCGGFHWFATGMMTFTDNASQFSSAVNNSKWSPRFGGGAKYTLGEMDVACHEKVRRIFELGDDYSWKSVVEQGRH